MAGFYSAVDTRYSSDKQSESSLVDQERECRQYADRQGWEVVGVYSDAAISGISDNRPEFQQMCNDASAGKFDVILAEALDRLARNLADTAYFYQNLTFDRIGLHTKDHGQITPMHVAFIGHMSEQFITNLSDKVIRGQRGLIHNGKTAGGLGYGYIIGSPGERKVDEEMADIVREIFLDYSNGVSPRAIAKRLNNEGIPGPTGKEWKDTTIHGQRVRGTGLLNNEAYIGRLIYGRTSYRKDPQTGRKVARIQPEEEWLIEEVPELRIVSDELWSAVKEQQTRNTLEMPRDANGTALNRLHRKQHVLSGILRCGCCGGNMSITGAGRYGCSSYRASRTCSNSRSIPREEIEERVLGGLQQRLLQPEMVEEYLRVVEQELRDAVKQQAKERRRTIKRIHEIKRKIDRLLEMVMEGSASASANSKLLAMEAEQEQLEASLATLPDEPDVIPINNISSMYADRVRQLIDGLSDPSLKQQAINIIQSMIEYVMVTPEDDGFSVDLHGELGRILEITSENEQRPDTGVSGRSLSVVAGVGFEPTTFRL